MRETFRNDKFHRKNDKVVVHVGAGCSRVVHVGVTQKPGDMLP